MKKKKTVMDTKEGGLASSLIEKGEKVMKSHKYEPHPYVRHTPETAVPVDATPLDKTPKTVVPVSVVAIDITGKDVGGAVVPGTKTVTAKSYLRCPQMHTYKPGEKIFMRHGTTICPKCEMRLEAYIPFGE